MLQPIEELKMIQNIAITYSDLTWPLLITVTWLIGELVYKFVKSIPKTSVYITAGLLFAGCHMCQINYNKNLMVLTNIAVGFMLFECGYRVNLRWIKINPWVGFTTLIESLSTLIITYLFSFYILKLPFISALVLATVLMSAAPEISLKIVNALKRTDQAGERSIYLSTLNFILVIAMFTLIRGLTQPLQLENIWYIILAPSLSICCGIIFAIFTLKMIRWLGSVIQNITITYSVIIILIVVVSQIAHFSFILSILVFGLTSRHFRIDIGTTEKNFGTLGELLTIVPFIIFGSIIRLDNLISVILLALFLMGIKMLIKTIWVTIFSSISGISWIKGSLIGITLAPVSIFSIFYVQMLENNINHYTYTLISAIWFLNIISIFNAQKALTKELVPSLGV